MHLQSLYVLYDHIISSSDLEMYFIVENIVSSDRKLVRITEFGDKFKFVVVVTITQTFRSLYIPVFQNFANVRPSLLVQNLLLAHIVVEQFCRAFSQIYNDY